MKWNYKLLACAVGAGLLTVMAGPAKAEGPGIATTLEVQLAIGFNNGEGKSKKVRITSKDLIRAIGEDGNFNTKGDSIIAVGRNNTPEDTVDEMIFDNDPEPDNNYEYQLVDKHGNSIENLTEDGVIFNSYEELTSSENGGSRYTENGLLDFEFYSNGDRTGPLDNTLEFSDDSSPYVYSQTDKFKNHNNRVQVSVTEKDGIGSTGLDFDITDFLELPVFGTITQNGSGKIDNL